MTRESARLNKLKLIKFDITETTEEHSKYLQSMMVFGLPALFFFNEDGNEIIMENCRLYGQRRLLKSIEFSEK